MKHLEMRNFMAEGIRHLNTARYHRADKALLKKYISELGDTAIETIQNEHREEKDWKTSKMLQ